MAKVRAYGSDASLRGARESTYGVAPTTGYYGLSFRETDLSAEIPLEDDPLLGFGRNAQDPYRGNVTDEGAISIPFDKQSLGFWLTGLFGDSAAPTETSASGTIVFSAQPANNSTITLNAVPWTFVTGSPTGNQTQIGISLSATLTALASDLNASVVAGLSVATYTADATTLTIIHDTPGVAANAYTLAASPTSNGTPSYATLRGGGYLHVWNSGSDSIPSRTYEIGHGSLVTPKFFRHFGTVLDNISFEMSTSGPANASVQAVAQGEEEFSASVDPSPTTFQSGRFSQGFGSILRGGTRLAGATAGTFTFSNNLERVRTIRPDQKIEAADPTLATATGQITLRFDGDTLMAEARDGTPVTLQYGFTMPEGWYVTFDLYRVFLPKPKYSISGPGGAEGVFDWRASYDDSEATMLKVSMLNDFASYVGL